MGGRGGGGVNDVTIYLREVNHNTNLKHHGGIAYFFRSILFLCKNIVIV